jgi:hypothetical protein
MIVMILSSYPYASMPDIMPSCLSSRKQCLFLCFHACNDDALNLMIISHKVMKLFMFMFSYMTAQPFTNTVPLTDYYENFEEKNIFTHYS